MKTKLITLQETKELLEQTHLNNIKAFEETFDNALKCLNNFIINECKNGYISITFCPYTFQEKIQVYIPDNVESYEIYDKLVDEIKENFQTVITKDAITFNLK